MLVQVLQLFPLVVFCPPTHPPTSLIAPTPLGLHGLFVHVLIAGQVGSCKRRLAEIIIHIHVTRTS